MKHAVISMSIQSYFGTFDRDFFLGSEQNVCFRVMKTTNMYSRHPNFRIQKNGSFAFYHSASASFPSEQLAESFASDFIYMCVTIHMPTAQRLISMRVLQSTAVSSVRRSVSTEVQKTCLAWHDVCATAREKEQINN